ncbi:MAG: type secretion system outer rane channel protein PorV [Bacteroidota bacterium]
MFNKSITLLLIIVATSLTSLAQVLTVSQLAGQVNPLTSAVPFLGITPDARAGSMGDCGVASSPDVSSLFWNAAKYAFAESEFGVEASYTPWLRKLVTDINLSYLVAYKKLDKLQTISGSLRYFSLGNIVFTDITGTTTGNYSPNEFALDFGYTLLLSKNLSGAIALRYIHSDLTGGNSNEGTQTHAGNAIAADISVYYRHNTTINGQNAQWALGTNITNIGNKITYSDDSKSNFLPMNLRIGGSLMYEIDDYNSIMAQLDLNKMLIPTPPIYSTTSTNIIEAGMNPDVAVAQAIFQSFYDAPGGFKEEMNEIAYSFGLEYWYAKQFAIRGGYFHENEKKGNRKFLTTGLGLKLNVVNLDLSYIVALQNDHPLKNTLRMSLTFELGKNKKTETKE